MFEDFRAAWREAVANFWRELRAEEDADARAAYREMGRARTQLERLDAELADTRRRLATEREQAAVCDRRQRMARQIGDVETARVAGEYAARHRERAAVLERKADALEAERALCRRDLDEMERAVQDGRVAPGRSVLEDLERDPAEAEFRNLEDATRERAAAERLEELKRRMGR
ncbi:MAG TPA: hypothetical protein VMM12_04390 [Longimicrobiales bacterium]|nr:hypothetical protein [Longimicrobiales bacterium]